MDTQEEIFAIATRLRGMQNPTAEKLFRTKAHGTYALPLEGMHPTMLNLFKKRLAEQVKKSGGDLTKVYMHFTETQVVWTTGFHTANSLYVSVGKNKQGQECLTFDAWLTDAEAREIAVSRAKPVENVGSAPATKSSEPSATQGITTEDAGF